MLFHEFDVTWSARIIDRNAAAAYQVGGETGMVNV